jgi:hypothetical protein
MITKNPEQSAAWTCPSQWDSVGYQLVPSNAVLYAILIPWAARVAAQTVALAET